MAFNKRPRYIQLFGDPDDPLSETTSRGSPAATTLSISSAVRPGPPGRGFAETFAVWLNPYTDWRTKL